MGSQKSWTCLSDFHTLSPFYQCFVCAFWVNSHNSCIGWPYPYLYFTSEETQAPRCYITSPRSQSLPLTSVKTDVPTSKHWIGARAPTTKGLLRQWRWAPGPPLISGFRILGWLREPPPMMLHKKLRSQPMPALPQKFLSFFKLFYFVLGIAD